jgi:hypothetical protein
MKISKKHTKTIWTYPKLSVIDKLSNILYGHWCVQLIKCLHLRRRRSFILSYISQYTIDKAIIAHSHIFGIYTYELILALVNNKFVNKINKVYVKIVRCKNNYSYKFWKHFTRTCFPCISKYLIQTKKKNTRPK